MKEEFKDKYYLGIVGFAIVISLISISLNISNLVICNETIVLTFIGIIATFIVIGNYSQVAEIRNNTKSQMESLDKKIQTKIKEFENLHDEILTATEKLNEIEKKTYLNSAEGSRLYGNLTKERSLFVQSVAHYIDAVSSYTLSEYAATNRIERILSNILTSLKPENWNKPNQSRDFNFEKMIEKVGNLPDNYLQKEEIINLLEKYKNEEK